MINVSEKFIFPVLLSSSKDNYRSFTACTSKNFLSLKSKIIKVKFYKRLVEFCLYLIRSSCKNINPNFIKDVFNNCEIGRDFFQWLFRI